MNRQLVSSGLMLKTGNLTCDGIKLYRVSQGRGRKHSSNIVIQSSIVNSNVTVLIGLCHRCAQVESVWCINSNLVKYFILPDDLNEIYTVIVNCY